jgi:hypothetical protein
MIMAILNRVLPGGFSFIRKYLDLNMLFKE